MKKLTLGSLRSLVREELSLLAESEQIVLRRGEALYVIDDEGNEEKLGAVSRFPEYAHLADGESEIYTGTNIRRSYGSSRGWPRRGY